jgi:hypothetical protein
MKRNILLVIILLLSLTPVSAAEDWTVSLGQQYAAFYQEAASFEKGFAARTGSELNIDFDEPLALRSMIVVLEGAQKEGNSRRFRAGAIPALATANNALASDFQSIQMAYYLYVGYQTGKGKGVEPELAAPFKKLNQAYTKLSVATTQQITRLAATLAESD